MKPLQLILMFKMLYNDDFKSGTQTDILYQKVTQDIAIKWRTFQHLVPFDQAFDMLVNEHYPPLYFNLLATQIVDIYRFGKIF